MEQNTSRQRPNLRIPIFGQLKQILRGRERKIAQQQKTQKAKLPFVPGIQNIHLNQFLIVKPVNGLGLPWWIMGLDKP